MSKSSIGIAEQLRKAICQAEREGQTRYAIAKAAGIKLPVLVRIANGGTKPRLDTAEKIIKALGKRLLISD